MDICLCHRHLFQWQEVNVTSQSISLKVLPWKIVPFGTCILYLAPKERGHNKLLFEMSIYIHIWKYNRSLCDFMDITIQMLLLLFGVTIDDVNIVRTGIYIIFFAHTYISHHNALYHRGQEGSLAEWTTDYDKHSLSKGYCHGQIEQYTVHHWYLAAIVPCYT